MEKEGTRGARRWRARQQVGPKSKVWHRMVKTDPKLWLLITLQGGGFDRAEVFLQGIR